MEDDVRVFFLRDAKKFPVACVASRLNATKALVEFTISVRNPLDEFNRQRGRKIAEDRLTLNKGLHWVGFRPKQAKKDVLTLIASMTTLPVRVREAAKYQLTQLPKPNDQALVPGNA